MPGPKLPTQEEALWQLSHAEDSLVVGIFAASSVGGAFATIFVILRIWSRRLLHGRFHLDVSDWLCVIAWIFFIPQVVILAFSTRYEFGRHVVFVTNPRMLQILSLVVENLYAVVLALLKLSVLSLYRQLFAQSMWFHRTTWAVGFVAVSLGIWVILASDLQCVPISATWSPTVDATCINYGLSALLAYIVNIVTDIVILSMPVPLVLGLQISKQKKWMLIFTFATGGSACIVSIVQLKYIPNLGSTADPSWDNAPIGIISSIECMVAFLAVSVATYRPLYRYLVHGKPSMIERTDYAADSAYNASTKNFYRAHISATNTFAEDGSLIDSRRGITATDQIELVRHINKGGTWVRVEEDHDGSPFYDNTGA